MGTGNKRTWRGWEWWQKLILGGAILLGIMSCGMSDAPDLADAVARLPGLLGLAMLLRGYRTGFWLLVANTGLSLLLVLTAGFGIPSFGGLGLVLLFLVISNRWKDLMPSRRPVAGEPIAEERESEQDRAIDTPIEASGNE